MLPSVRGAGSTAFFSLTELFVGAMILSIILALWLLALICSQGRRRVVILGRRDRH